VKDIHTFSYHLKDLAKRPAHVIREVEQALAPTNRDVARRVKGQIYSRYLAAKVMNELISGDRVEIGKLSIYLDRTEGKVADKMQVEVRSVEYHVSLPQIDQPSLDSYIDGHIADTRSLGDGSQSESSECKLDQQSSVERSEVESNEVGGVGEQSGEKATG